MCWSGEASAALAVVRIATTAYAAYKKESAPLWMALVISRQWNFCRPLPTRSLINAPCRPIKLLRSSAICTSPSSPSSSTCCPCILFQARCVKKFNGRFIQSVSFQQSSCFCSFTRLNERGHVRWETYFVPSDYAPFSETGISPGRSRQTAC